MDLSERLKEIMLLRGVRTSVMARDLNITSGHITDILKGRIVMPRKHLSAISSYLNVSEAWLITGVGDATDEQKTDKLGLFQWQGDGLEFVTKMEVDFGLKDVEGKKAILLIDKNVFPIDMVVVVSIKEKGDGLYLTRLDGLFYMSHRKDNIITSEWSNIPNCIDSIEDVVVVGKVECIFRR